MKHPHAELMLEYANDWAETDAPWERWEFFSRFLQSWETLKRHPYWENDVQYRRKPKPYEPTLLDQALELEIEAANIRCKHYIDQEDTNNYFWRTEQYNRLLKTRSPAMIEHLKQQGKI